MTGGGEAAVASVGEATASYPAQGRGAVDSEVYAPTAGRSFS
jgi:hypothetical protein